MSLALLLTFILAIALATALPGATIAALMARVLGRGSAGAMPFCAGLILGDVVWFSAAVLGLSVLAQTAQPAFAALRYAGAAYLLWLGWKLWTAPAEAPNAADAPRGEGLRLFFGGLSIALGNPKTMMFYIALMPSLLDLDHLDGATYLALTGLIIGIYAIVLACYVAAAARMRRLLRSARAMRAANRTTGAVMAGSAIVIATR